MFDALAYPFMQRALAAGVLVGVMTSLLGVLVVLRRSAFFGDAIAHAALAGVAVGVLMGWNPLSAVNSRSNTAHTAVWSGNEMLVWGGSLGGAYSTLSASYHPGRTLFLYRHP